MSDEESADAGLDAPDFTEALLGYRLWNLREDGGLGPITGGDAWVPGANTARCLSNWRHRAPHPDCGCGFNALHKPPLEYRNDKGSAIGAIAAWGEIDVYKTGFRAQYSCVIALMQPGTTAVRSHRLAVGQAARRYGVRVVPPEEIAAVASAYARPIEGRRMPAKQRKAPPPLKLAPLPEGALPAADQARGVYPDAHLAVDHAANRTRLGPTAPLIALAPDGFSAEVEVGARVPAGAPIISGRRGDLRIYCPTPAAGVVVEVKQPDRDTLLEGPSAGGWMVKLEPDPVPLDYWSALWGRAAADDYRARVLAAGSDAALLEASFGISEAEAAIPAETATSWLRAFCRALERQAAGSPLLGGSLDQLGTTAALDWLGRRVTIGPRTSPAGSRIQLGHGREPDVVFELDVGGFNAYWSEELELNLQGALTSRQADGNLSSPGRLTSGDRGTAQLAHSIHRRLVPSTRAILSELGNPWFRAGEAARDGARMRRVLAGATN